MKKQLLLMNKEHGFILPYTMFVTTIILIIILSHVKIYQNEVEITNNTIEYIQTETLIQMGITKFRSNYTGLPIGEQTVHNYNFPTGNVAITTNQLREHEIYLQIQVTTNNSFKYSIGTQLASVYNEYYDE